MHTANEDEDQSREQFIEAMQSQAGYTLAGAERLWLLFGREHFRRSTPLEAYVKKVHDALEAKIAEARHQQSRCKSIAEQIAARHGEEVAKRVLIDWAATILSETA
jgi:hypothetical protein